MLAGLVLFSETLAWQTGITATVAAFGWDFIDYQTFAPRPLLWVLVVVTTAMVAVVVARYPRTRSMLLLVTWMAVANAFRFLFPPSTLGPEVATLLTVFVVFAAIVTLMVGAAETTPNSQLSTRNVSVLAVAHVAGLVASAFRRKKVGERAVTSA